MALSLPFPLSNDLGTLDGGLGCFPLDNGPLHPLSACRAVLVGIWSLLRFGKSFGPPSLDSALPPTVIRDALPK